jgi:hypothetical protein
LNGKQKYRRVVPQAAFGLLCLMALAKPALAQVNIKPAIENWRPKDGLYALPGKDFDSQCGEYGDIVIGLSEKSVSGHEWDCKVTRRTDTAPDAIRLNMTCSDYNLAATLFPRDPKSEEKEFKEVLGLKKINKKSMLVQKTLNGKFPGASWQADYCPENWQLSYIESRARAKTEAEQKANKRRNGQPSS